MNREKKKNIKPSSDLGETNPDQGVPGVDSAVIRGIFKETASRRRMEMAKVKKERFSICHGQ